MRTIPALAAMAAITAASTSAAESPMDATISMKSGPAGRPPRIYGEPTSEMMLAKVVRDSQRKHRSRNTHPGKR